MDVHRDRTRKARPVTWAASGAIAPGQRPTGAMDSHPCNEHLLSAYILAGFGERALAEITPAEVRSWWSTLPADKPTVRARSYTLLKAIMNTAVVDDVIAANPCRIRGASSTPRARDVRPASLDELTAIVAVMPERYHALVLLAAWCALRSGEMLELRRRDVDLRRGTVRVERAVSWVRGQPVVGTPKSVGGIRTVAIPPHVLPAVERHLENFTGPRPDDLLFPGRDGVSHLMPSTLHGPWRQARAAAGRADLRLHDLRHTGATMAAMAGRPSPSSSSDWATAASTRHSATSTPRRTGTSRSPRRSPGCRTPRRARSGYSPGRSARAPSSGRPRPGRAG